MTTQQEKLKDFATNVLPHLSSREREELFLELLIDGKTFEAQRHAEAAINEAIKTIPSPFTVVQLKFYLAMHYGIKATPNSSMLNYLDWLVANGRLRTCGYQPNAFGFTKRWNRQYELVS